MLPIAISVAPGWSRLISGADLTEMHRVLSERAFVDVRQKLDLVAALDAAPRGTREIVAQRLARQHLTSVGTIYRHHKAFFQGTLTTPGGGWQALVDARSFPRSAGRTVGKPSAFIQYVEHELPRTLQRDDDGKEAHRCLLDRLAIWRRSGDPDLAIPGYSDPPDDDPATGYPRGWSYEEINAILKRNTYARRAGKQGAKDAAHYLPSILSTRVGTAFLSDIAFDDQDYDQLLVAGGHSEALRPCGFNALDFHSAAHLDYHLRLVARDDETGRKKTLTKREATWFLVGVLSTVGYRTDHHRTRLIVEHATADSWRNKELHTLGGHTSFQDALHKLTDGQVWHDRSGLYNQPAIKGLFFKPQSSGNPNFKPIEVAFRLVRTFSQSLPGQTGRKFDLAPTELHGLARYEKTILKAVNNLDSFWFDRLQHGLLTVSEWSMFYRALYRAINRRTGHSLEGWHELQYTRTWWREDPRSEDWHPAEDLAYLSPIKREIMEAKLAANPRELTREDLLSPHEVVQRLCKDPAIKLLDPCCWAALIPMEWSIPREAPSNRQLIINDPVLKTTKHNYLTTWDEGHRTHTIQTGTKLRIYHNPLNPDFIVVHHAESGQFIARLDRIVPGNSHRPELQIAQLEQRARIKADLDAPITAVHATLAEERRAMIDHNDEIRRQATGAPSRTEIQADRRAARAIAAHTSAADDAFDRATTTAAEVPLPDPFDS